MAERLGINLKNSDGTYISTIEVFEKFAEAFHKLEEENK